MRNRHPVGGAKIEVMITYHFIVSPIDIHMREQRNNLIMIRGNISSRIERKFLRVSSRHGAILYFSIMKRPIFTHPISNSVIEIAFVRPWHFCPSIKLSNK